MYLYEFQMMGGIFTPKQMVEHNEHKKKAVMRGVLSLRDHDFYVTVSSRSGALTKITSVAGMTYENAVADKQMLCSIRADGLINNICGLKTFTQERIARTFTWLILMLLFCFGVGLSIAGCIRFGLQLQTIGFGVFFLLAFLGCAKAKHRLTIPPINSEFLRSREQRKDD